MSTCESSGNTQVSRIARCAQLAMLLEVSASPKPGNIDRDHDYEDTQYEHFIASAVGVYPVMEEAARSSKGIGKLMDHAVCQSVNWQSGGNTHFGAFLLLIPLSMAAGDLFSKEQETTTEDITARALEIVRSTDTDDAVDFYKAFTSAGVRVNDVEEFDLQDESSTGSLKEKNTTLYDLMEISKGYGLIANEWTCGFKRCEQGANIISSLMQEPGKNINDVVVYTFLKLLSENPDTFIQTKFDAQAAEYVSGRAKDVLSQIGEGFTSRHPAIEEFDSELLQKRMNPGSTADIIIASLFLALLGGVRL